jgi:hypothetical protein
MSSIVALQASTPAIAPLKAYSSVTDEPGRPAPRPIHRVRRYPEIDITRGILLTLMASSHAIGLAGVAANAFLRSGFWLPRGWATAGFPMLTGFTVALVFRHGDRMRLRSLRVRAGRLFVVLFVTNICFLFVKHVLSGRFGELSDLRWWARAASFQVDPTISAVLVPTALVLLTIPWLMPAARRIPRFAVIGAVAAFFAGAWAIASFNPAFARSRLVSMLFVDGLAGFPIISLASCAPVGLLLGVLWSRAVARREPPTRREALAIFLSSIAVLCWLPAHPFLQSTIGSILRFLTIVSLAVMLTSYALPSRPVRYFSLLGQYSLFVFITHRLLQQAMLVAASRLAASASMKYGILAAGSLIPIGWLCAIRQRHIGFDRALNALFL